ncbi:MAG: response regulator transcription factor, partial [Thermoanaerobaculia bacterium]|nr:response regulator transcription factor [Thermoanaerobaculia bacterium]
MISVAIVDDHPVTREGVRRLLEEAGEFFVTWEASDGREALKRLEQSSPKVLIVDISMPGLSGLEVVRQVAKTSTFTKVLVVSMSDSEVHVFEALRSGADGYVLKTSGGEEILDAVKAVAEGGHVLSSPFDDRLYERYVEGMRGSKVDPF